jgi:hypothetical protein
MIVTTLQWFMAQTINLLQRVRSGTVLGRHKDVLITHARRGRHARTHAQMDPNNARISKNPTNTGRVKEDLRNRRSLRTMLSRSDRPLIDVDV